MPNPNTQTDGNNINNMTDSNQTPATSQFNRHKGMKLAGALTLAATVLAGCSTVQLDPLKDQEIADAIKSDEQLFQRMAPAISEPLDVNTAMARALKYNLDHRVKLMEQALSHQGFELAKMDMLPMLAANAGYTSRNNVDASRSESVLTGIESLEPSTSVDQEYTDAELKLSWNVLDFGVSYLKAKQEADRVLIAGNARKDIMAKLLQQTRAAYWRAAVTQRLKPRVNELLAEAEFALGRLEQIQEQKLRAPLEVLQEKRRLLSVIRSLRSLQRSADSAEIELATLINQPPGERLPLAIPRQIPELQELPEMDVEELERIALANSGEYLGQLYNARIAQREARKSMLRMLPGLEFSYSGNYNSNSYLYNNAWAQAGVRISWNIMRVFAYGDIQDQNESREQLVEAQRLAANMATIARVNLGWQQYKNSLEAANLAQRFEELDEAIASFSEQARASSAISGTRSLVDKAKALNTAMTNALAYADAQEAFGGFLSTLGFNPVPFDYQTHTVDELAMKLDQGFENWQEQHLESYNDMFEAADASTTQQKEDDPA